MGKNYALAFEFHDDIILLDDADAPQKARFYQVKTKAAGNWTFAQITARQKDKATGAKKPSFAGKMFDNFLRFGTSVERLTFVSNQPLPDVAAVHCEAEFSKADKIKLKKFTTDLAGEATQFNDLEHTKLFYFHFAEMNLPSFEATLLGKIADFLDYELGLEVSPRPFALYLNDYCRKRSKTLSDVTNFDQLKASKFLTRSQMAAWLTNLKASHEHRPSWNTIAVDLKVPLNEKAQIEREWRAYSVLLQQRHTLATLAFTHQVRGVTNAVMSTAQDLTQLINGAFSNVRKLVDAWHPGATDAFVKAVILYEFKR